MANDPIVQSALDFQKLSSEAFWSQRQREDVELHFLVPEKQWPENVQAMRAGQTVQGVPLPPRVMLSIPSLQQPIQQTYNQWSRAHFGVHVSPISQEANDETAEIIQGVYRHIEVDSRAGIARGWGYDRGIKAGFGGYRVDVVYDETTDDPDGLKVVIKRVLRQSSMYWDPFAVEPDFCDQTRHLITSWISRDTLKREHPDAKMSGMSTDELLTLQSQMPNFATWSSGTDGKPVKGSDKLKWYDGANDAVCIAEFFWTEYEDVAMPAGSRRPKKKKPIVKWAKINAVEVLEERTWNGKYIPMIPTIGNEQQPFDTERRWVGIIGPNKDAARLINYEVSSAVEKDALATKAPWIGAVGQFRTNQAAWQQANTRNFPYLEYDPVAAGGQLAPPPQRNLESPDLSSSMMLIQLGRDALQTGTAITDSSALENLAKRKVAQKTLASIQDENQNSQSQYVQNMADLSMSYEAKVILDLIPKIYDRPERVAQILGEDGERKEIMLNATYANNPKTGRPIAIPEGSKMLPPGIDKTFKYDLTKGIYQVVVEVGKSYQTRSQEGSDALGNLITSAPEFYGPMLSDIWMGFQTFPGHKEAQERMKKSLPPNLQENKDDPNDPEVLRAQRDQAMQQAEQAMQQMQEMGKAIETDQIKAQADLQKAQLSSQADLQKAEMSAQVDVQKAQLDNHTKMAIARLNAETEMEIATMKARLEHATLMEDGAVKAGLQDDAQQHEHGEAMVDRAHELNIERMKAEEAEKNRQAAAEQAERGHEQALEQGEQGHQHAVELVEKQPESKE
jgi:hypothetical protein